MPHAAPSAGSLPCAGAHNTGRPRRLWSGASRHRDMRLRLGAMANRLRAPADLQSAMLNDGRKDPTVVARQAPERNLDRARTRRPQARPLGKFLALVLALSVPFWVIGAATDLQLFSGLSASALMAFCPAAAAVILAHRGGKRDEVAALLARSFDFRRIRRVRWYLPALLLMPAVSLFVYGLMREMDMALPAPQIHALPALLMFLGFLAGALGEELGWSGYALGPMQSRWSALRTGATLGLVAIIWHLVPLVQQHRAPTWIAWWCLYVAASRILIVWLYNNTGESVWAVSLFHATLNLAYWLFPVSGSHFDMRLGGLVMAAVAGVVVLVWGPGTLTGHDNTRRRAR